ncbi:unnamed protein product, partial [Darwinula stevensoni]
MKKEGLLLEVVPVGFGSRDESEVLIICLPNGKILSSSIPNLQFSTLCDLKQPPSYIGVTQRDGTSSLVVIGEQGKMLFIRPLGNGKISMQEIVEDSPILDACILGSDILFATPMTLFHLQHDPQNDSARAIATKHS